jgi:3-oxoacyl-[acyl-carrier protein] reductase
VDLGLSGKVALVGGSSKGLGRASALALAREGARVTICARTEADLAQAAVDIRQQTGADVLPVTADFRTAEGIESAVAATAGEFGGVDILVHNTGGPPHGTFGDLTDQEWLAGFEAVTLSFVRAVRAVLPYMRAKQWGRIVGIQSVSVKQPVGGIDLSNGMRPGVAGLMKAIMPDLASDGITINLVLPGTFRTARIAAADPDAQARRDAIAATIPLGRVGDPAELGDVVAFLASERASYITGAAYQVDGGSTRSSV